MDRRSVNRDMIIARFSVAKSCKKRRARNQKGNLFAHFFCFGDFLQGVVVLFCIYVCFVCFLFVFLFVVPPRHATWPPRCTPRCARCSQQRRSATALAFNYGCKLPTNHESHSMLFLCQTLVCERRSTKMAHKQKKIHKKRRGPNTSQGRHGSNQKLP